MFELVCSAINIIAEFIKKRVLLAIENFDLHSNDFSNKLFPKHFDVFIFADKKTATKRGRIFFPRSLLRISQISTISTRAIRSLFKFHDYTFHGNPCLSWFSKPDFMEHVISMLYVNMCVCVCLVDFFFLLCTKFSILFWIGRCQGKPERQSRTFSCRWKLIAAKNTPSATSKRSFPKNIRVLLISLDSIQLYWYFFMVTV